MSHYQHYRRLAPEPSRKQRLPKGVIVIGSIVLLAIFFGSARHDTTVLADQQSKTANQAPAKASKPIDGSAIAALIATDTENQVGVAVRNISTGTTDTYGIDSPFMAASTTKVLSAITYYHLVEDGRLSLDTKLGSFPAWFQIKQMIINSSNESWHLLSDEIGNANLQAYATSLGMDFTQGPNTMSPASMALLLSKLYAGTLLNKQHTQTLLSYMRNTNNETLIPAALPKNYTTYHKYGDLDDELHDAAIVVHGNQQYAIVIFTKGSGLVGQRTELIKQITDAIVAAYSI